MSENFGYPPKAWWIKQTKVDEIEKDDPPLGFLNSEWEKLKARMVPGDEIWEFDSPGEYWASLAGEAGIVLVRDDTAVFFITTERN